MALSRSHTRPDSVPALNLGNLSADLPKTDNVLQNPTKSQPRRLQTPDSRSTISWGTGLSTPYHVSRHDIKFGGTVHRPCTHVRHEEQKVSPKLEGRPENTNVVSENLRPAAQYQEEYKKRNLKIVDDKSDVKQKNMQNKPTKMNENADPERRNSDVNKGRTQGKSKASYWYLDKELRDEPPTPKVDNSPTIDDLAQMQAEYTGQSYTNIHSARKYAAEDDLATKQKQQVMEQVLADMLSRHVISDPDQDKDPARANPADPLLQQPGMSMPPVRLRSRRLHDTKVSTVGAVTETSLQSRVTFSARILTQNGRDALRELFGFFFLHDRTITVYEYRNFGKNNFKAMPLIARGAYRHQSGRRKGKEFGSNDIQLGKNLSFITTSQKHLPESITKYKLLTIRVSAVDDSNSSVDWQCSTDDRGLDTDARRERMDREVLRKVQAAVRKKLSSRSVSVLMGLGQLFRGIDKSGDGLLSKTELSDALQQFGISVPSEDFDSVWRVVDENDDGAIDYGEFMRAFIGEMSESRKQLVRKVFKKLDPHKSGSASLLDMKKLYSAKKHPLVTSGQLTQEEMEVRFVDSFSGEASLEPGRVSYVEFEEYYEGLSIVVTADTDFSNVMRNCWGV